MSIDPTVGFTVAAMVGGLVTTTVVATAVGPLLTPLSWPMSMAAGAILAVAGFLGDLTVSAVERDLGVKDTGSLIPGWGSTSVIHNVFRRRGRRSSWPTTTVTRIPWRSPHSSRAGCFVRCGRLPPQITS